MSTNIDTNRDDGLTRQVEEYLAWCKTRSGYREGKRLSSGTVGSYRRVLRALVEYVEQSRCRLEDSQQVLEGCIDTLSRSNSSEKALADARRTVIRFYGYLIDTGVVPPSSSLKEPKPEKRYPWLDYQRQRTRDEAPPNGASAPEKEARLHKWRGLIDAYLNDCAARSLSEHTLRGYRHDLTGFVAYMVGEGYTLEQGRMAFRAYLSLLVGRKTSSKSLQRIQSVVQNFYRYLVRTGTLQSNPLMGMGARKAGRTLPRDLTREEVEALIQAPKPDTPIGLRDRAIIETLYATGVRVAELVGIKLEDVDLEDRTIVVRSGKGGKDRMVLLHFRAVAALEAYINGPRQRHEERGKERGNDVSRLFLSTHDGQMTTRAVQLMIERYARRLGIEHPVTPHMIRHSFATHLNQRRADIRVIQHLLGHASVASTERYVHVNPAEQRDVVMSAWYNLRKK